MRVMRIKAQRIAQQFGMVYRDNEESKDSTGFSPPSKISSQYGVGFSQASEQAAMMRKGTLSAVLL